jgi:hypothetical protein
MPIHRALAVLSSAMLAIPLLVTIIGSPAASAATARTSLAASAESPSAPGQVDMTGTLTWTQYDPAPDATGGETTSGTFNVDLTDESNGSFAGDSSSYSLTDTTDWYFTNGDGCTTTYTGSFSSGGALPDSGTGAEILYQFDPPTDSFVGIQIYIPYSETLTETLSGTCSGTSTSTISGDFSPNCFTNGVWGINGNFEGTFPNGTVDVACSGTEAPDITYSVTGSLTVGGQQSHTFTVAGDHPVAPNSSQDTHATDPGSVCSPEAAKIARDVGQLAVAYMLLRGAPDGAGLLRHFLADSGTSVNFPDGSAPSSELAGNPNFKSLQTAVLAQINDQLGAGITTVDLNEFLQETDPPSLNSPIDLYYAFRGTQGMTVSGSGTVNADGSYSGTLTFTILDSYGFTVLDAVNLPYDTGALMRYLQINCGDSPLGAHWFPDSITLTVPFTGQLS